MNSRRWISRWTSAGSNQARRWGFRWIVLGLLWSVSAGPLQAQLTPGLSPQAQLEAQREQVVLAYYEKIKELFGEPGLSDSATQPPRPTIEVEGFQHYTAQELTQLPASSLLSHPTRRLVLKPSLMNPGLATAAADDVRLSAAWSDYRDPSATENSEETAAEFLAAWLPTNEGAAEPVLAVTSFQVSVDAGLNAASETSSFVWVETLNPLGTHSFKVLDPVLDGGGVALALASPEVRPEVLSVLELSEESFADLGSDPGSNESTDEETYTLSDSSGHTEHWHRTGRSYSVRLPSVQDCQRGLKTFSLEPLQGSALQCEGGVTGGGLPIPPAHDWWPDNFHSFYPAEALYPGSNENVARAAIGCLVSWCPRFPCAFIGFSAGIDDGRVSFKFDLSSFIETETLSDQVQVSRSPCPGDRRGNVVKVKVVGLVPDSGHIARIVLNTDYQGKKGIATRDWRAHFPIEEALEVGDPLRPGTSYSVTVSQIDELGFRLGLCGSTSEAYTGVSDIAEKTFVCEHQPEPVPFLRFPQSQRCPEIPELCGIETPDGHIQCYFHGDTTTQVNSYWGGCLSAGNCAANNATITVGPVETHQGQIWCVPRNVQGDSEAAALYDQGPMVHLRVLFPEAGVNGVVHVEGVARDDQWGITRILANVDGGQPLDLIYGVEHGLPDQFTCDESPSANCDANSGFRFAFDANQLSIGDHVLEVLALNDRPEFSVPSRLTIPFTVRSDSCDSPALPTTYLTAPADRAVVAGTTTLAASATDDTGVSAVDFYVDGVFRHQDTTPPYEWAWDTTVETDGAHEVRSLAIDTCGNRKFGPQHYVTVANHPQEISLLPVADAFVSQTNPSGNFGAATILRVRTAAGGYGRHGYLLFDLPEITGRVVGVKLRLRGGDYPIPDFTVWHVRDTAWTESTLNWTNASMNAVELAGGVYVPVQGWIDVDLPAAVDLVDSGLLSLALSTGVDFQSRDVYSRESAFPPELVIEVVE